MRSVYRYLICSHCTVPSTALKRFDLSNQKQHSKQGLDLNNQKQHSKRGQAFLHQLRDWLPLVSLAQMWRVFRFCHQMFPLDEEYLFYLDCAYFTKRYQKTPCPCVVVQLTSTTTLQLKIQLQVVYLRTFPNHNVSVMNTWALFLRRLYRARHVHKLSLPGI